MYRSLSVDGNPGDTGPPPAMPGYFMASFFPMDVGGAAADAPPDRALVASRNHREAERRRRERIKSNLDRLRILLACDPKTDKASLLAKAVEHVRDLKQQAAEVGEAQLIPTETDEIAVFPSGELSSSGVPMSVFKASVCCEDRSDLIPELIETLRSLRLRTLRAEMATLGGRVRNVLVLARETEDLEEKDDGAAAGSVLRDALKSLVDRLIPVDRSKRRRVMDRALA